MTNFSHTWSILIFYLKRDCWWRYLLFPAFLIKTRKSDIPLTEIYPVIEKLLCYSFTSSKRLLVEFFISFGIVNVMAFSVASCCSSFKQVVARSCSIKMVLLKISQNLRESTFDTLFFNNRLEAYTLCFVILFKLRFSYSLQFFLPIWNDHSSFVKTGFQVIQMKSNIHTVIMFWWNI